MKAQWMLEMHSQLLLTVVVLPSAPGPPHRNHN